MAPANGIHGGLLECYDRYGVYACPILVRGYVFHAVDPYICRFGMFYLFMRGQNMYLVHIPRLQPRIGNFGPSKTKPPGATRGRVKPCARSTNRKPTVPHDKYQSDVETGRKIPQPS